MVQATVEKYILFVWPESRLVLHYWHTVLMPGTLSGGKLVDTNIHVLTSVLISVFQPHKG